MTDPVLFVPGFPGSHLRDADGTRIFLTLSASNPLLAGPDTLGDDGVRADEPIRAALTLGFLDIAKQAGTLYDLLDTLGVDPLKHGWDWRRPVWDEAPGFGTQARLAAAIEAAFAADGPVTVIAHSTGGLVVRALLEARHDLVPKVGRLIAFGVPWAGVLLTLDYLNGDRGFAGGLVSAARSQEVIAAAWAAFDLIPPDPAHLADPLTGVPLLMTYRTDAGGAKVAVDPFADLGWLDVLPVGLRAGARTRAREAARRNRLRRPRIDTGGRALDVVNVVGWGWRTSPAAELVGDGAGLRMRIDRDEPDAVLGRGDGTVPRRSAAWLEGGDGVTVRTYHLPVGYLTTSRKHPHASLWSNPGGRDLLRHLLAGAPLPPLVHAAIDHEDSRPNGPAVVRVWVSALDAAGQRLPAAVVEAVDLQPANPRIEAAFSQAGQGRALIRIPRARMRRGGGNRVLHFELRVRWNGGVSDRLPFTLRAN